MSLLVQFSMGPCFYCGVSTYRLGPKNNHPQKYTRDHLIPKRMRAIRGNPQCSCHLLTVTCCLKCNHQKGAKSALEFIKLKGVDTAERRSHIQQVYNLNGEAKKREKIVARKLQKNNDAKIFPSQQEECHAGG